jgi:hypothetical protein
LVYPLAEKKGGPDTNYIMERDGSYSEPIFKPIARVAIELAPFRQALA